MSVRETLWRRLEREKLHMTLIDPEDHRGRAAAKLAEAAERAGSDAIMIGGSTGYTHRDLDASVASIKDAVDLPVIIFPTSASLLTPRADAIYFMVMMNSRDPRFLTREQMRGAPLVRLFGIEPISMGYIIVEPGMKVGEVGSAEVVGRGDGATAAAYALAAEFLGMQCVYLEAGSGAPLPVPPAMVRTVKGTISIPLLVGGGVRTPAQAREAARAGADIVVTGTVVERSSRPEAKLNAIVKAVKGA